MLSISWVGIPDYDREVPHKYLTSAYDKAKLDESGVRLRPKISSLSKRTGILLSFGENDYPYPADPVIGRASGRL